MKTYGQLVTAVLCLVGLLATGCAPGSGVSSSPSPDLPGTTPTHTQPPTAMPTATTTPTMTSTVTPTSTATPTPLPALTVLAEPVKLREGPGEDHIVVAAAAPGENLLLNGKSPDAAWLFVITGSGQGAWVSTSQVDLSAIRLDDVPLVTDFPEPPPAIKAWQGDPVRVVCLGMGGQFTGNYANDNPNQVFGPANPSYSEILAETKDYLRKLGLTVVDGDGECQAAFTVNLSINLLRANYTDFNGAGSRWCYTGVTVDGSFALTAGETSLRFNPSRTRPTRTTILSQDCSVYQYFEPESLFIVLDVLDDLWGQALALPLQKASDSITRYYLSTLILDQIRNMGANGKIYAAPMIACYENNYYRYPMGSVSCSGDCPTNEERWLRTMVAISGEDLQYDMNAWKTWLASQGP